MSTQHWPCLMYHDVLLEEQLGIADRGWFAVSKRNFDAQLDAVLARGLSGCSIARAIEGSGPRVALSFDDGMLSDFESAFPALVSRGMTATFFVVTGRVGTAGRASWGQLREMAAAGMSIQSHTRTHPFLSELDPTELRDELLGSKRMIDDALGQDTDQLAYPGGDAPRAALQGMLVECGYRVVATSRWGRNSASSRVPQVVSRCTIAGVHDPAHFRRVLAADPVLAVRRRVRESILAVARRTIGPTRYARWRRLVLDEPGRAEQAK